VRAALAAISLRKHVQRRSRLQVVFILQRLLRGGMQL
jgi:hypothetical protein